MFTSFLYFWFVSKSFILIIVSLMSMVFLLFLEEMMIICLDLSSFVEMSMNITLLVDKQSLTFTSTVSTVSWMIIMYSFFYMDKENNFIKKKFILILLTFITSMLVLSFSANIFWLMVGWDGLGISSFCLIIFYQNWKSLGSGMVTFLSNRFGDTLIIMSMILIILDQSPNSWMLKGNFFMILFLILGAYSKSAQLPYLFWLPQAMAAPTPVSALVHSSTLVTAGVFVTCRFNIELDSASLLFFMISSITVMMAGTSSLMEFDLKKVIALSTLCHVSLMMMFSILGEVKICLFHLMMHAFFKSLLFMVAGYLIHCNGNSQDIRYIYLPKTDLSTSLPFFISILSMMGYPFMSGFYSKEVLLEKSSFSFHSMLMICIFMINSFFSCAYSVRLSMYMFSNYKKSLSQFNKNPFSKIFIFSSIFSSFLGGMLMVTLMPEEETIPPKSIKVFLILFSILGIFIGSFTGSFNISTFVKNLTKELWKSNFLYKIFQSHFFLSSHSVLWMIDEKGIMKVFTKYILEKTELLSFKSQEMFLKEPFSIIKTVHLLIFTVLIWLI